MKHFLSFDIGTTAMKCVLFDEKFNELYINNIEYALNFYDDGRVELCPDVYFDTFCRCTKELSRLGVFVDAISFTTQGETFIPIDACGKPLNDAIVWIDDRAGKQAEKISAHFSPDKFYKTTGLCEINGALPLAKLMFFKENNSDMISRVHKILLLEDYFIYRLTGKFCTEKSLVSSTGWYNIADDCYFDEALLFCGIDKSIFPTVLPCGTAVAKISEDMAQLTSLSKDTLVVTGAMDQIASAIGAGNIREGIVCETTGTALVLSATVAKPDFDISSPITVYKHFDDKFIYIPYCNTAGIVLKWFKDTFISALKPQAELEGISLYALIDKMAKNAPCTSGGVILLPHFSGKNAPREVPNAKGVFFGLTLSTDINAMCRSVLEGVAYMLRELVEALEEKGVKTDEIRSVGGGSVSDIWHRIKTDVCKKKIISLNYSQTTSIGAAILSSLALGVYGSAQEALSAINSDGEILEPICENSLLYDKAYEKYKALYAELKDIF